MAPPAPGRLITTILLPSCFDMPSASNRAVTSADDPAGNSTVISIVALFGKVTSCAKAVPVALTIAAQPSASIIVMTFFITLSHSIRCQYFRHFNAAPLAGGQDAGANRRERPRRVFATHFRTLAAPHRRCELLELFGNRVVAGERNIHRPFLAALEHPQAAMHVVIGARFLAVD